MSRSVDTDDEVLIEFKNRLTTEWLPTFCDDPRRKYACDGFRHNSIRVAPDDARDFLRALDLGIVTDSGGGRLRAPRTNAFEQIFWTWTNAVSPKPITLWLEPIITIAAVARLHLRYGWPKECLGTQSKKNWAFDLFAVKPGTGDNEYIAAEVKKTAKELDQLVTFMRLSCTEGDADITGIPKSRRNAHKKWIGLRDCRAPIFWAVGPGGISHVYRVTYSADGPIDLEETKDDRVLQFPC